MKEPAKFWMNFGLGTLGVLLLNAGCGALLPPAQEVQPVARAAQPARTVPLRVVRGGRAA